jgi:hypothetical protein
MPNAPIPVRIVNTSTTLNEVGRVVDVLPVRATTDLVAVNEVGRPIDVPLATIEAGLIATNEVGGAVSVAPVRIVTDPFVPDAAGRLVFAQPLRGLATAPVNTVLPVIAQTGSVLSVTTGTWTGTAPITYAYQFTRNGTPISGATASTYTIPDADLGALFGCIVTATNSAGNASAAAALLYVGVLDVLSVASTVPFSLRRLSRNHTGDQIRVRRSSDNAEADIGWTANGDLDTTALLAHVGSQNLLLRSQEFENAVWEGLPNSAETIAANSEIAPDGTLTAERCTVLATSSGRFQNITLAAAGQITYSVFIKAGSAGTWSRIGMFDTAVTNNQARCWVNMLTGALGTVSIIGSGWSGVTASSTPVGDGWYRISLTATCTATAITMLNTAADADNSTNRTVGHNRILWGAQLNTGATAQPYFATTSVVRTGDGFVTTWYDKSVNGLHATQATPANQPRIVSAGVIETENGKPTIVSNGNQWLVSGNAANWTRSTVSGTNNAVLFRRTASTTVRAAIGANVYAYLELVAQNNGFRVNTRSTPSLDSNPVGTFTSLAVVTTIATPTSLNLRVNGTSRASVSGPTMTPNTPTSGLVLFDRAPINNSGENFTGAISEAIIFKDTDVSVADAQILERNQGAYYGITVA